MCIRDRSYTVTEGPWRSTQVDSASQSAGTVVFRSGATLGSDTCPEIEGLVPDHLVLFTGFPDDAGGYNESGYIVSSPTQSPTVSKALPAHATIGDSGRAFVVCNYKRTDGTLQRAALFYFASTPYQVGP